MLLHIPTLLTALFTVMLTAAGITTFVGLTQRVYRGFWYWVAAQWLACTGMAFQLLHDAAPQWQSLSILLLLQWPIMMLAGARRFYVRTSFPTNSVFDVIVIALAYLGWWTVQANGGTRSQLMSAFFAGMVIVHAYAFWVGLHVREWRHSAPLRGLLGLQLLIGVVYAPRALMGLLGSDPSGSMDLVVAPWTLLLTTCCVLFSLYLVMLLTNERTERGLQDSQRQLRVLANIDMLTQVPNRRYFNDLASQSLQLNAAAESTLMVFDLDHFKDINDTQGHAAGDDALRLVARSARETLRARDVLGRLGGDEFIVLLPETTVADALHVADRIVLHVDAQRPPGPGSAGLSLSFGVVQMLADEALDRAVRRADQALEEAKRQGRSRAVAAGENAGGEPVFTETRPLGASVF